MEGRCDEPARSPRQAFVLCAQLILLVNSGPMRRGRVRGVPTGGSGHGDRGLEALRPAPRADTGTVRAHPELFAEAAALRLELPGRSAAQIASILYHRHGVKIAERTVRGQLRRAGLHREALAAEPKAYGRYEAARPNERWITDVLIGPSNRTGVRGLLRGFDLGAVLEVGDVLSDLVLAGGECDPTLQLRHSCRSGLKPIRAVPGPTCRVVQLRERSKARKADSERASAGRRHLGRADR